MNSASVYSSSETGTGSRGILRRIFKLDKNMLHDLRYAYVISMNLKDILGDEGKKVIKGYHIVGTTVPALSNCLL